jgi:hypothetical protein
MIRFHLDRIMMLHSRGQVALPLNQPPRTPPTSIELKAALRYTGTRLRAVDRVFRSAAADCPTVPGFILNISKA